MKVLIASSEIVPFASTGGLGDVCAALPKALAKQGLDVCRVMPLYRSIDRVKYHIYPVGRTLIIPMAHTSYKARIYMQYYEEVTTFFIHSAEFFDRDGMYGSDHDGFNDNFERFVFFQKAVVALIDTLKIFPDIVHCNDWHTALIPMFLEHGIDGVPRALHDEKTLFTIHNLAYQGWAQAEKFYLTQLPQSCYTWKTLEFYGEINCLKGGLVAADHITTVSPTYASEIVQEEFGNRLEGVLLERSERLSGILNGVDYDRWNPKHDPYLKQTYDHEDLTGKQSCKREIQALCGFSSDVRTPLITMISRLTHQKGMDLLSESIDAILERDVQILFLGTGDERYERMLKDWEERWPDKVAVYIEYSSDLAHQFLAASDMYIMPSIFEPCGQSQIYGMRYGSIPIVHRVGGLADTVVDYPRKGSTGFCFDAFESASLLDALDRACACYHKPKAWKKLMVRAMEQDYSVHKMASNYAQLYKKMVAG